MSNQTEGKTGKNGNNGNNGKFTKEDALRILRDKQTQLTRAGESRYPKRSDFSDAEVCAVKAFLGPWPRALEAAGLKPPRTDGNAALEKRIRLKRRATALKKASSSHDTPRATAGINLLKGDDPHED